MRTWICVAIAAAVLVAAPTPWQALQQQGRAAAVDELAPDWDDPAMIPDEEPGAVDLDVETFVGMVLRDARFMVASADLALRRETSEETRTLAQTIFEDHSEIVERLETLRRETEMILDPDPELDDHFDRMLANLEEASDAEFDDLLAARQLLVVRQTIGLLRTFAEVGDHEDFRDFAQETLPTLEEHRERLATLSAQGAGSEN